MHVATTPPVSGGALACVSGVVVWKCMCGSLGCCAGESCNQQGGAVVFRCCVDHPTPKIGSVFLQSTTLE